MRNCRLHTQIKISEHCKRVCLQQACCKLVDKLWQCCHFVGICLKNCCDIATWYYCCSDFISQMSVQPAIRHWYNVHSCLIVLFQFDIRCNLNVVDDIENDTSFYKYRFNLKVHLHATICRMCMRLIYTYSLAYARVWFALRPHVNKLHFILRLEFNDDEWWRQQ